MSSRQRRRISEAAPLPITVGVRCRAFPIFRPARPPRDENAPSPAWIQLIPKHQSPSPREYPMPKLQPSDTALALVARSFLGLEAWGFFGAWGLGFGVHFNLKT
jgi:hypothetical protein